MSQVKNIKSLPKNWISSKLTPLLEVIETGSRPKGGVKDIKSGIPSIGGEHLTYQGTFNFDKIRYVPDDFAKKLSNGWIRENDILVVKDGATTGKTVFVDISFPYSKALINEHVVLCRTQKIEPKYIFYFLFSQSGQTAILSDFRGAAQGGISKKFSDKVTLPLPPLNEQKRIVAKIEELLTKLDAGVAALKKVRAELKRYRQAVLKAAFEGTLTADWRKANKDKLEPAATLLERIAKEREKTAKGKTKKLLPLDTSNLPDLPDGWEWVSGDTVFPFITSGSRGWAKYYSDTGAIFLRVGNLDHYSITLDLSDIQYVQPPSTAEGIRTRVLPGDILISVTADVGMTALVPEALDEAYVNQHVALTRPISLLNRAFIAWYIASPEGGQRQFSKLQRGATKVGLGLDDIRVLAIPFPSISEQNRIVEEIDRCFSVADKIEQTIERSLKEADRLRQSILKKAFEGKLVPQDPTDEPAEKLLERIKAEKDKQPAKAKTKETQTRRRRG